MRGEIIEIGLCPLELHTGRRLDKCSLTETESGSKWAGRLSVGPASRWQLCARASGTLAPQSEPVPLPEKGRGGEWAGAAGSGGRGRGGGVRGGGGGGKGGRGGVCVRGVGWGADREWCGCDHHDAWLAGGCREGGRAAPDRPDFRRPAGRFGPPVAGPHARLAGAGAADRHCGAVVCAAGSSAADGLNGRPFAGASAVTERTLNRA